MRYQPALGLALLLQAATATADPAAGGMIMIGNGEFFTDANPITLVNGGDLSVVILPDTFYLASAHYVIVRTSILADTVSAVAASTTPSSFAAMTGLPARSGPASPLVSIEGTGIRLPEQQLLTLEEPAPPAQPARHKARARHSPH